MGVDLRDCLPVTLVNPKQNKPVFLRGNREIDSLSFLYWLVWILLFMLFKKRDF